MRHRGTLSELCVHYKLGYSSCSLVSLVPLGGIAQCVMETLWKLAGWHCYSTTWLELKCNELSLSSTIYVCKVHEQTTSLCYKVTMMNVLSMSIGGLHSTDISLWSCVSVSQCTSLQLLAELLFEHVVLYLQMSQQREKKVGGKREIWRERTWMVDITR